MAQRFDIIVIGGGAGGLVVASVAAQLDLEVLLVDKHADMGGDCLHFGCVPSKTLLKSASVAHDMRHAEHWGLAPCNNKVELARVNESIRQVIASIQPHDSRERFESLGCTVLTGTARFIANDCIEVNGERYSARRIVIATGSVPAVPPIPGLKEIEYLTNENMFDLPELPESLLVLGGGPVGVEMAQAFCRLGSKVTLIERAERILPAAEVFASEQLTKVLTGEGVDVITGAEASLVAETDGKISLQLSDGRSISAARLLVAIGRRPELGSLELDAAGIEYDNRGVKVNRRLQTSNRKVYACGDVTGVMPLTHVAELQAGIVIANIVFRMPKKVSYEVIPAVVYTDPEVASVGITEQECLAHLHGEVHHFDMSSLDRAITDRKTAGRAMLLTIKGRIVGAHIVAPHAGEMIHELALAIQNRMKVSAISSLVHAYPAYAQLNKRLAGQYYSERLFSGFSRRLVSWLWSLLP
jgi:pyruvate/2-oxoglutarate dehydrogenase complex dihydrolipoamide dehydrogenase (E3) component